MLIHDTQRVSKYLENRVNGKLPSLISYVTSIIYHHCTLGHPVSNPGYKCGIIDGAVQYSWQSSKCNKKLGYICYSEGPLAAPTEGIEKIPSFLFSLKNLIDTISLTFFFCSSYAS